MPLCEIADTLFYIKKDASFSRIIFIIILSLGKLGQNLFFYNICGCICYLGVAYVCVI